MDILTQLIPAPILILIVKIVAVLAFTMGMIIVLIYVERKLVADFQQRIGPHRAGPLGVLQPIADGIKLFLKEDITPANVNRLLYVLAPILCMAPALMTFAVIPFGPRVEVLGQRPGLWLADLNIGVLYILALGSLGIYGIILGGWSSNSKYSLLGAMRSAAQMVSYELPLGVALLGPILFSGKLSMVELVEWQISYNWLVLLQPLAFVLFMVCAVAETNRAPFDLPEAESELVAGFHTEYSGFKFAMFFMAEYAAIVSICAVAVAVFLGGWSGPVLPPVLWFLIKLFALIFIFMWLRATFPRLRYDHFMRLAWLRLLPLGLASLFITALILCLPVPESPVLVAVANAGIIAAVLVLELVGRARRRLARENA
ncbi:MAG: NADH-quinone oxidoreductase subunit NuoH [Armatimonadota bacterium]